MFKFIGGTLLIIGTSIGAGILALPVTTAQSGFITSSCMLFGCWLIMTLAALMILEVNLWFPEDSNMISMAKHTLGLPGEMLAWLTYLLLLYALLCAYISGGTDVLQSLLNTANWHLPAWLATLLFTSILGSIVFCGIRTTDYANRLLMTVKLLAFILLTSLVLPKATPAYLTQGQIAYLPSAIMVMITSFGFATIIPSLRSYFKSDLTKLRLMIIIGSFIPLLCYLLWDLAILGTLPLQGDQGMIAILNSGHVTAALMTALQTVINQNDITQLSRVFTSICVLTSFLGVALCLMDFLADGCKLGKQGKAKFLVAGLTFLPPLIIVLFFPSMFIRALNYAGLCCVILLIILPTLMTWRGVHHHQKQTLLRGLSHPIVLGLSFLIGLSLLGLGLVQTF